jgi:hypothetical protein
MHGDYLLGEIWEAFYIQGYQVGVLNRTTTPAIELPNVLMSRLQVVLVVAGEITSYEHVYYFYNRAGFPSHSYLFDAGQGAPVHVRFADNQMICQIDDDVFIEKVPGDARPSYAYYPLVATIPFIPGYRLPFTRVDDASCSVEGHAEFVSHGWAPVLLQGERVSLWRVDEYARDRLTNQYWLDDARRIRQSKWLGAISYWVPTKETALAGLSHRWITAVAKTLENSTKIDWSSEVISWLTDK